jgi:hypothetical protein
MEEALQNFNSHANSSRPELQTSSMVETPSSSAKFDQVKLNP